MLNPQNLPAKTKELLQEIEETVGTRVLFMPNPHPISPTDPNPEALACAVGQHGATVFYRSENIEHHQLTHELLHIHRYLVQDIPQILPFNDLNGSNIQVTSHIENTLEHLTIVPEEEKYGYEPYSYWDRTSRDNWQRFQGKQMNSFAMRKNCLLGWLTVKNLTTDPKVAALAERKIRKLGLLQKAIEFNFVITSKAKTKEEQLRAVLGYLNIPLSDVRLVNYIPREGRTIERHFLP